MGLRRHIVPHEASNVPAGISSFPDQMRCLMITVLKCINKGLRRNRIPVLSRYSTTCNEAKTDNQSVHGKEFELRCGKYRQLSNNTNLVFFTDCHLILKDEWFRGHDVWREEIDPISKSRLQVMKCTGLNLSIVLAVTLILGVQNLPAQRMSPWEGVFVEEFDDNRHHWPEPDDNIQKAVISEGQYRVKGKSVALPFYLAQSIPIIQTDSVILEMTVTQRKGKKNMGYGICWGARPDRRDCYVFLISANRQFTILRMQRGKYRHLQPWTSTDLIRRSKEQNTLKVAKEGGIYTYYINDHRVFRGPAEELKGPLTGIILHGSMELEVESIKVVFPTEE